MKPHDPIALTLPHGSAAMRPNQLSVEPRHYRAATIVRQRGTVYAYQAIAYAIHVRFGLTRIFIFGVGTNVSSEDVIRRISASLIYGAAIYYVTCLLY